MDNKVDNVSIHLPPGLISAALSSPVFVPQMSAASFSQTAAGNQA